MPVPVPVPVKPYSRACRLALDAVGCAPDEVVFLDDIPGNCAGARAAGLVTVQVDVPGPGPGPGRAGRRTAEHPVAGFRARTAALSQ